MQITVFILITSYEAHAMKLIVLETYVKNTNYSKKYLLCIEYLRRELFVFLFLFVCAEWIYIFHNKNF